MNGCAGPDWNPESYARFRGIRLRPALDLLAQVPDLPAGPVVDLGCGTGLAGPALRQRFPCNHLTGLDASPAMLAEGAQAGVYDDCILADIADWAPVRAPVLIFANAVLHWLPDHSTLMPALAMKLAAGGALAVQMPNNYRAPSHTLLQTTAARLFPGQCAQLPAAVPVMSMEEYVRLLEPLGQVEA